MKTVALLCDHTQKAGDKLFVSGANINRLYTDKADPPFPVNVGLAIMVTIPWNATNQKHVLTLELIADQGGSGPERVPLANQLLPGNDPEDLGILGAEFNAGRSPEMQPGEDTLMPLPVQMNGLQLPRPGSYFFDLRIDGTPMERVVFRLEVISPMVLGQPLAPS
jgi:hypothetical protein